LSHRPGYSLGEMLAALVIGALVLTAILAVYSRANRAADAVLRKIESPALAEEVLQLMAEDLDRVSGAAEGTSITIASGFDNGFARSQLILRRTFKDGKDEEQTFEEIIWRAGYDYESPAPGLVVYRSYEGIGLEDKLLDQKRETWERNYPLVPICCGVTFFRIEVPKGDDFVDQWSASSLPPGVKVTISFAEPYQTVRGTWDVLEDQKISRIIAIDRTRKIKFTVSSAEQAEPVEEDKNADEQPVEETRRR
jgi:hypothetical protein